MASLSPSASFRSGNPLARFHSNNAADMSFQRFGVTFFLMTQNNKRLRFAIDGRTARHRPANSAAARRLRSVPRLAPKLSPRGKERPPMTSPSFRLRRSARFASHNAWIGSSGKWLVPSQNRQLEIESGLKVPLYFRDVEVRH